MALDRRRYKCPSGPTEYGTSDLPIDRQDPSNNHWPDRSISRCIAGDM